MLVHNFHILVMHVFQIRFCVKIRLSQKAREKYTNFKYEDIISVKMTSIDSSKVADVEVQNENDISTSEVIETNNDQSPNTSTIAKVEEETVVTSEISTCNKALYSLCKEKSIVNALTVGEVGTLEVHAVLKNNTYGITLLPNNAEHQFDKVMASLAAVPEDFQRTINNLNIEDMFYGQQADKEWVRGYIVSELPFLKIANIDEAKVETIKNITTCEQIALDTYAFSALCEITDDRHKLEDGDICEYEVLGRTRIKEQDGYEILIYTDDSKIKATVKPWIPTLQQLGTQCAEVNNETEVCVTGYRDHIHMYVRPINTVGLEHYNHVMQTIAKCAETSPFLRKPPNVGDAVIVQSADENYYRAFVTRVQDDRITILYLDLGRKEVITDMKKLKILPDNLKKVIYMSEKSQEQGCGRLIDLPWSWPSLCYNEDTA
ncbi:uncharacterized protein LOC117233970 isoform X3 [Bombus vosnesenskii]|uniref:Uncharacterized protein LOC117233970 isoform X3 n=1 Tax=Bombus vosnesenskii TaxID=207650 RepID=A0A6J3KBU9_9HYME|nr:uncharacterized protein LOC117233970 isoform X3 [Bombus vosnesenskii]